MMRIVNEDKDLRKVVYIHYIRIYGDHEIAMQAMTEDLIDLEDKEHYEQCSILHATILEYA